MRQKWFLLAFCVLLSAVPALASKRAFTIEDLYRIRGVEDLSVSADGKMVVFVLRQDDLGRAKRIRHLWVMDADGQNMRQFTYGDKSETSPVFSPDGKWIAFVRSRDGDPNIFLISTLGGEARPLTKISTGVSGPLWSPDGKWIAFSSDVYPECGADDACNKKIADRWSKGPLQGHTATTLLYRHWTEWKDGRRTHLFLASVGSGEVRDLTPGDFDAPPFQLAGSLQYDFSPDSSELVYESNHDPIPAISTNDDLWTVPLAGNAPAQNITAANLAYDGNPKYSPDGKYIAYRMQKQAGYESDLFRLAIYDRSTHSSRVLTESFRNWVDDFEWAPDSKSLYFSADVEGNNPVYHVSLGESAIQQVLVDATIDAFKLTDNARRMIFVRRSVGDPPEIFTVDLSASPATPQRISHFNDAIANEVDIRPAEKIWVTGADGAKIEVFIVKPHDFDPNKRYPTILNVHGGPQSQWQDAFRGDWQVYPGAGYVVAFPNPHGSTGYGQEFTAEISGDHGGKVFEDLMKVTDELAKLPYVDPNRMGAMGWSYGGYMMDWFEGHTDRFKAIASM
ncbi:MAG: S9 family peptidase, partial [Candidatus Acidiferrum sp.]